jgi:S-(hydroxymethyl)glutathione dehydrogenase/alcohol dehydrogenase
VGVRLAACAVCHSDLTYLHGAWGGALPAVYGHEAAGVVEQVGPGVVDVAPGDHVVVAPVRFCGRCPQCLRGLPVFCEGVGELALTRDSPLRSVDGAVIQQGLRTAAFAERVTVHASQAVAIPRDVPLESAALIACGVLTGVGAVLNTAAVETGSTVGVLGTGGVGLNAVQGAVLSGASLIVAVDLVESKLAAARAFGATHAVSARDDVTAAVYGLTGGRGLDCVVVTAGTAAAVEQAVALLAAGGTAVLVGMPAGATATIHPETVADRGLRIVGSKLGSARPQLDVPYLVELYRQGRLKLDELVSARYPLAEVNEAVAAAEVGEMLRAVVVLNGG